MKKALIALCLPLALWAADDGIIIGGSIDSQRAISLSKLQVSDLLNEKHTLKERLIGGELRIGYRADRDSRLYVALDMGHQRNGFHNYNASVEYNYAAYLNRFWSFLIGGGVGYSIASLDRGNVMIGTETPGELHFNGFNYTLKTGFLFNLNQRLELEFALKARHLMLGSDQGSIILGNAAQNVTLDMDKTFTFTGLIGLNIKF